MAGKSQLCFCLFGFSCYTSLPVRIPGYSSATISHIFPKQTLRPLMPVKNDYFQSWLSACPQLQKLGTRVWCFRGLPADFRICPMFHRFPRNPPPMSQRYSQHFSTRVGWNMQNIKGCTSAHVPEFLPKKANKQKSCSISKNLFEFA